MVQTHKKQTHIGVAVVLVVSLVVSYAVYHQNQKQIAASEALTGTLITESSSGRGAVAPALVAVANEHSDSVAGGNALMIAGGQYFIEGKYSDAQKQFERYRRDFRDGAFQEQAMLGLASSLEAQGKTNEAVTFYKQLSDRRPSVAVWQAKFALGRLYETQGMLEQARNLYDEVGRQAGNESLGVEGRHANA